MAKHSYTTAQIQEENLMTMPSQMVAKFICLQVPKCPCCLFQLLS